MRILLWLPRVPWTPLLLFANQKVKQRSRTPFLLHAAV